MYTGPKTESCLSYVQFWTKAHASLSIKLKSIKTGTSVCSFDEIYALARKYIPNNCRPFEVNIKYIIMTLTKSFITFFFFFPTQRKLDDTAF